MKATTKMPLKQGSSIVCVLNYDQVQNILLGNSFYQLGAFAEGQCSCKSKSHMLTLSSDHAFLAQLRTSRSGVGAFLWDSPKPPSSHSCLLGSFPLWRRCFPFGTSPEPSTCTLWSTWLRPAGSCGWFCLNSCGPFACFCLMFWWYITSFGAYGHSVFNTFVQLTEGRSAKIQFNQDPKSTHAKRHAVKSSESQTSPTNTSHRNLKRTLHSLFTTQQTKVSLCSCRYSLVCLDSHLSQTSPGKLRWMTAPGQNFRKGRPKTSTLAWCSQNQKWPKSLPFHMFSSQIKSSCSNRPKNSRKSAKQTCESTSDNQIFLWKTSCRNCPVAIVQLSSLKTMLPHVTADFFFAGGCLGWSRAKRPSVSWAVA